MRKWRCEEGREDDFIVGKIYESNDEGFGLVGEDGFKYNGLRYDKFIGIKFTEVFDEKKDKKMNKFKVGDRVRIIGNHNGHCFEKGDIVELYYYSQKDGDFRARTEKCEDSCNWVLTKDLEKIKDVITSKTFTITTSDKTTTLTDGTHTTSINRYYTDKHDDMVALEEVVKKYKSEMEKINKPTKGKDLIGVYIPEGTKFRVINVEPHRRDTMVCIDEYVGKIGRFDYSSFTFTDGGFKSTAIFEEDYMNAIDKKNGRLCWRYDEVEILWED